MLVCVVFASKCRLFIVVSNCLLIVFRAVVVFSFCRAFYGVYFTAKRQLVTRFPDASDFAHQVPAAMAAGISYWSACYPIDVAKVRIFTSHVFIFYLSIPCCGL